MAEYTKEQLLFDINDLVERYLEQELTGMQEMLSQALSNDDAEGEIVVESDSEGDDIDMRTGDIWDLNNQEIIGRKDLESGTKTWFGHEKTTDKKQKTTE